MFGLLGVAEAVALVVMGAISAPLFVRPSRRGGPVLIARRIHVCAHLPTAVQIEADQSGLLTRLLALFGMDKKTTLEVTEDVITYRRGGFWREHRVTVPLSQVSSASWASSQPLWHISAIGVIATILAVSADAGRLTQQEFGAGIVFAGVCGILCAMQRTVDLVIESSGGTRIALTFSDVGAKQAITLRELTHAAERITELAMLKQRH